ncbi:MAG: enoyl-CoA hydratase/isomerase family protein [Burkholderiales bacterium]|nr:enoyl-CoA hydratase/isomerase family protein [Burkholderiales bacterium]
MQNSSGKGTILWELDARGVATVVLNRPEVNNAYNGDLIAGVHEAMDALGRARGLRALVLKGKGRHFQAGADLAWISAVGQMSPEENERASRATGDLVRRLDALPVPTVALVQGGCFGGGTGIVAACDIVVASDDAIFAITETRWGLMAGIILPQLCQAIGLRALRRYALTGERFDAHEARRIGLAHEVCAPGKLEESGAKVVDALLMNAPAATAATKLRSLQLAGAVVEDALFADLVREHASTRQLAEAAEGLASFREKRKPGWYPAAV